MSESVSANARGSVDDVGPQDAPPIVLVHGAILNRKMWAPQLEVFEEDFHVVAPDLPGHGDRRDEPFRLEEAVATVESVLDRIDDDRVHLVGLSLGGYVATAFAHRNPERVESLVVASSSANFVGMLGLASKLVGKAAKAASKVGLVERAVDALATRWVRSRDIPEDLTAVIVAAGFDLKPFGEAGVELADEDFRRMLSLYDGPSLVLNGKWDILMRSGERKHAEAARNATVTVVDGAGHTCNLDNVRAFDAAVEEFIAYGR